jgi:hypothetical protein
MIRKLQRWWLSQFGPAVKVEYNPVLGKWRVRVRYSSFGIWLTGWHPKTFKETFDNLTDTYACEAHMRDRHLRLDQAIGEWDRTISFASRKVKW